MLVYATRRLLLMVPTIFGVIFFTFVISSFVPGGPVDTMIAQIQASSGGRVSESGGGGSSRGQGLRGFDPAVRETIAKQLGYDKPPLTRFALLIKNDLLFDFGKSGLLRHPGDPIDPGTVARFDLARHLDDDPLLSHLDTARHPEGRTRWNPVRHRHVLPRIPGLRHPQLLVGRSARHLVLQRHPSVLSPQRFGIREFRAALALRQSGRLSLAHRDAGGGAHARIVRDNDGPHEELLPRRDQ